MRFKRRQVSTRASMRKREAIQPRKLYRAEVDTVSLVADSNVKPIARGCIGSVVLKGRGERAKVISAYRGGLTDS